MTRQDLVNKSIDKLNTVKEALELIEILEYDECIAVLTGTKNLPYCHIDYDDDIEILELMLDTTLDEMTELIPNFDRNNLTSRQKLLAFMSVKELYDNRDKYRSDTKTLSAAVSSMLLKEIYGGAAE